MQSRSGPPAEKSSSTHPPGPHCASSSADARAAIEKVTADTGVDAAALAKILLDEDICAELTRELASGYTGLLMPEAH
jgi:hypothetical protein